MAVHRSFAGTDVDDLIDAVEEPIPPTQPSPGQATLVVEDKMDALFISATWTLVARVKSAAGTIVVNTFGPDNSPHDAAFTRRWVRQYVRQNKRYLRSKGVNVNSTYAKWGGDVGDLEDDDDQN